MALNMRSHGILQELYNYTSELDNGYSSGQQIAGRIEQHKEQTYRDVILSVEFYCEARLSKDKFKIVKRK